MLKVLETFYDGNLHTLFLAGTEIADDPSLLYAEKRGLVVRVKAKEEEAEKKPVTKKTATKKK